MSAFWLRDKHILCFRRPGYKMTFTYETNVPPNDITSVQKSETEDTRNKIAPGYSYWISHNWQASQLLKI